MDRSGQGRSRLSSMGSFGFCGWRGVQTGVQNIGYQEKPKGLLQGVVGFGDTGLFPRSINLSVTRREAFRATAPVLFAHPILFLGGGAGEEAGFLALPGSFGYSLTESRASVDRGIRGGVIGRPGSCCHSAVLSGDRHQHWFQAQRRNDEYCPEWAVSGRAQQDLNGFHLTGAPQRTSMIAEMASGMTHGALTCPMTSQTGRPSWMASAARAFNSFAGTARSTLPSLISSAWAGSEGSGR